MNHHGPKESILNIIQQMLCYDDGVVTDNPHMRAFDWRLRLENVPCHNPFGSEMSLAPGQTASIFSTVTDSGLDDTSVLDMDFVGPLDAAYRLSIASGSIGFRTPRSVTFLSNSAETGTIQCIADASGSLNNKYFLISSTTVEYYVWYNIGGAGTDPALPDKTGIMVAAPTNSTAIAIADATATAMAALSGVFTANATVYSPVATYQDVVPGVTLSPLAAGTSGFTVTTTTVGGGSSQPCVVTINNNSVAMFDFTGATLSSVQVGDIMRINGQTTYDTPPYAFNNLNSGTWIIIGMSGTTISAIRPAGIAFQGIAETPASPVNGDVIFYANDMVMPGMMFTVSGTFSQVTQRTYQVIESTPTFIQFVSTQPIPVQDGVTYVPGTITFYDGVKKMVYIEVDQECSVQYNGQTDSLNRIVPIKPGDKYLRGYANKWGDTYSCNVTNQSINSCRVRFLTVE